MAADTMTMGWRSSIALWLSEMQDQKSLMFNWHSFSGGGSDIVETIFAHKGSKHYDYSLISLHSSLYMQYSRPNIIATALTVICGR